MRLFAALLPPPAAAAELAEALSPVRRLPGADALRWTDPAGWHFTLAFLGEVPDPVRPALDERFGRTAAGAGPHGLRLAGGGRFGERALWVGAEGDLPATVRLAASVRAAADRAGAPSDEQFAFAPHLTVARAPGVPRKRGSAARGRSAGDHRGADLRPFVAALDGFRGTAWVADTLSLVSSLPPAPDGAGTPAGPPRYTVVASWPLGAG